MEGTLVTVVIPAYNAEQFLHENIESVINQTYPNLEIIYVCDGCSDRTAEILQAYASRDSRITVQIEGINCGAATARNIGMSMAKGDWIIFLDADDLVDCHMIEILLENAINAGADMSCCYWEYFEDTVHENAPVDSVLKKTYCKTYPVIDVQSQQCHIMQLVDNSPVTKLVHQSLYRKKEVFFQNIPNANDVYYSMVVAMCAQRIVYADQALYHYRGNRDRQTLSTDRDSKKNFVFAALDKVYDYIQCREYHSRIMRSFYNMVLFNLGEYRGYSVYDMLFDELRDRYFHKWGMYESNIVQELSYVNRILYKKVLNNDKEIDRQSWCMQAKVALVSNLAEQGCSVWGVGNMGNVLLEETARAGIRFEHVFDSNPDKRGSEIHGYVVESYHGIKLGHVVVTASRFYDEIAGMIGNKADKIHNIDEQIWLIPEEMDI